MIFQCPYCDAKYETDEKFLEVILKCGVCHQKFTMANPPNENEVIHPFDPTKVYRYKSPAQSSSPDHGLLTPTNILAGIGLYSLLK